MVSKGENRLRKLVIVFCIGFETARYGYLLNIKCDFTEIFAVP